MSPQQLQPSTEDSPKRARSVAACKLSERLQELGCDRVTSARGLAAETARELHRWALEQPASWTGSAAAEDLEQGWHEWSAQHAWRGACSRLLDDLRLALSEASDFKATLIAEARAWIDAGEDQGSSCASDLMIPERTVRHAVRQLRRGDWVLVHGYSELCIKALAAAQHAGLAPSVIVSELAADASGKRMARELMAHGVQVRLSWDLASLAALDQVDQVWLGPEAIGAGVFVAYVGSSVLLERARENEVPTFSIVTANDLLPGGEASLPAWGASETDALWCFAPEGVELESQPFEFVDASLVDTWITDAGTELFADFCLRGLRAEAAPALTNPSITPRAPRAATVVDLPTSD